MDSRAVGTLPTHPIETEVFVPGIVAACGFTASVERDNANGQTTAEGSAMKSFAGAAIAAADEYSFSGPSAA